MKVIIAGGRNFENYTLLLWKCVKILRAATDIEIVSGRCSSGTHTFTTSNLDKVYGADGLGERFAQLKGYHVKPFPADWSQYGNSAGPIRNRQMAEYADVAIVFWDGQSRGSSDMIQAMNDLGKPVRIIKYA